MSYDTLGVVQIFMIFLLWVRSFSSFFFCWPHNVNGQTSCGKNKDGLFLQQFSCKEFDAKIHFSLLNS